MPISYHPGVAEVLWCNFEGREPEMTKRRLSVVVSPKAVQRARLVTVVPLSTTPPEAIHPWHCQLERDPLPNGSGAAVWAKCDMVAVVCWERLCGYHTRWAGKREYKTLRVSLGDLQAIRVGILHGLGMGSLAQHL